MMSIAPLVWIVLAQVPTTPLSGTVVGPGGEPVAGAELVLVGLPSFDPPIVGRGKSDAGGRFSLERPTALAGDHHPQRAPILWVFKPGFQVSATRFPEALPKPEEPVRLVLEPPGRAEVHVEGPDGQPLGGVKVRAERLKTHYTLVPDVVAEMASATTGPDGVAVLDAFAPAELAYVDVHSRAFGIQGRPIVPRPGTPAVVALRPASTWKGHLSADDPGHARGWHVQAWTRVGGDRLAEPQPTGYVETTTDDEGRFALAPIAVGALQLDLKPPGDLPVLADLPASLVVREGDERVTDIPLRKPVTVTGLILERGTAKPVPGIQVSLSDLGARRNRSERVKTDESGRYTLRSLPGRVRVSLLWPPPTHVLAPGQHWMDFDVPEGSRPIELTTREALPAAPPLRGAVRDEAGRAVPGAHVEAAWMLSGANGSSDGRIVTTSDEKGDFVLEGLGPDSTVTITARLRDRQVKEPVKIRAGETDRLTVSITPTATLAVAGRLLGPGGTPLAGIVVTVQFRVPRGNFPGFPEPARFEDNPEITTAADGTFRTPKELERKPGEFRVEVTAPGFLPARTVWVPVSVSGSGFGSGGDLLTLPDLTLKRSRGVRVVVGKVVDRAGTPVSGAEVSQAGDGPSWTSARTDPGGRFRLSGVAGGQALVFAEAPGFRFGGAIVGDEGRGVEITLARTSEPPIAALKRLPSPLLRAEERALARELLEPLLPLARTGAFGIASNAVVPALARVDPARVLVMIENRTINGLTTALIQVALGQFEDDPAVAIATLEDDLDPGSRAAGWLALEDFRPAPDRTRRENFLERALADARQAVGDEGKIRLLGQVADRWLEAGAFERARPILREGQELVAARPRGIWSFEAEEFAEVLAAIDLPAALALFERRGMTNVSATDAPTLNRHKAQAAVRLARIDPAGAERLIAATSPFDAQEGRLTLRAARAMATVDLARARRVLESLNDESGPGPGVRVSPALVPFGLGLLADALVQTNPDQARTLLDEAFTGLRTIAVDGQPGLGQGQGGGNSVASLMAGLLPVVERLEPDRLAERAWLVAACRGPTVQEPRVQEVEGTFALAMRVARYDRAIADALAAPTLERLPDLLAGSTGFSGSSLATIAKYLAAYDPRAIAPLIRALPEPARKPPSKPDAWTAASSEAQIRLGAAQILGVPNEARPREAGHVGRTDSTPDTEDFR
jgi:hypothetical protein